ncbi:MAG TPA: hypothetical protein VGT02_12070 [Methylomirabilota bacterium]|nr:hypothetical protein [Methylomirabilota bacterium]
MTRALTLALLVVLVIAGGAAAEVAVTAVSVASLKVTAGARASVTLQGTDLDQIQSAVVLKGTAPGAGVTAELAPAAGKTSRMVTIVTQTSAAPGRDYKLQLTGGKQTVVPALAIEIASAATAAAPETKPAAPVTPTPTVEPKTATPGTTPTLAPKAPTTAPAPTLTVPKATTPPAPAPTVAAPAPKVATTTPPTLAAPRTVSPPTATAPTTIAPRLPTAALIVTPSVSSVVPSALQLAPGGKVTLALYGQSLDRLQAVSVTPARTGTSAVTATLGPAAPTMRTLTLTAGPATPAGRYQLTAQAGTTSLILNAAVNVSAPPPAPPVLLRVEPGTDGYALVGRNFGADPAKVVVYEGFSRVSTFAMTLTPDRISVRSRPTGTVQHRVEVAGASSGTLSFTHPGATIGSVGVSSAELARILASPKAAGARAPAAPLIAPGAPPRAAGPAAAPSPSGPGVSAPTGGSTPPGASTPSVAGPRPPPSAPRPQAQAAFVPRSAVTPELTMTGLGPQPGFGQ